MTPLKVKFVWFGLTILQLYPQDTRIIAADAILDYAAVHDM